MSSNNSQRKNHVRQWWWSTVQRQMIIAKLQVLALAMGSLDEIEERGRLISHGFLHPNPKPIYLEHSLFEPLLVAAII